MLSFFFGGGFCIDQSTFRVMGNFPERDARVSPKEHSSYSVAPTAIEPSSTITSDLSFSRQALYWMTTRWASP